jgi:hypothetical protein
MNELAGYSIQAIAFAVIAMLAISRSKKADLYHLFLISAWLVGVIVIYARYGEGQVLFYSNDQLFHRQIIEFYLPIEGLTAEGIIGLRYLLTVPVYAVSLIGFHPMLLNKFAQLIALLLIYQQSKSYLNQHQVRVKVWHLPFITGPLLLFMSLLSLRDVILACFAVAFVLNDSIRWRILAVAGMTLLRPHLGVAMLAGLLISELYQYMTPRYQVLKLLLVSTGTYVIGTFFYWIGAVLQKGVNLDNPSGVFTQTNITRMFSNFTGFQFLTLRGGDDAVVAASTLSLVASRLIFFETFAIPLLFILLFFRHIQFLTKRKLLTLQAFIFFYGIVSQTPYNSTRQNIPFLACMGVLAVADLERFQKMKQKIKPALQFAAR